jgi:toxin ParE1/3/4
MLPLVWSDAAKADLAQILDFIAEDNELAARRLKERFDQVLAPVSEHPYLYRPGRLAGTREIVAHPNYIVVYRVLGDSILVEAVIHARQKYPPDE